MIPKFRAWDKLTDTIQDVLDINFIEKTVTVSQKDIVWYKHDNLRPFKGVVIMQSTGLKDKNGVEIYEGDVLFHPLQGRRKVFYPYSETVASYGLRNIDNGFGSTLQDSHAVWEVIGNIYEQPELLGGQA